MATLIRASGASADLEPRNAADGFTLPECYALLDCTAIETITLPGERVMIVDADGRCKAEPIVNCRATFHTAPLGYRPIVGHVLICRREEFK